MDIIQVVIGEEGIPDSKRLIEVTAGKQMRFLENLRTRQKVKITKSLATADITIDETAKYEITNDTASAYGIKYRFNANSGQSSDSKDMTLVVGVNKYSFNPYIARARKGFEDVVTHRGLIFIEINTKEVTQLRYFSNMEIIAASNNRKSNKMCCLISYSMEDPEQKFTMYGVNNNNRFFSYTINPNDDTDLKTIEFSDNIPFKTIQNLRGVVNKFNRRPLKYRYSGKTLPARVVCYAREEEAIIDDIMKFGKYDEIEQVRDNFSINIIPDDIDLTDKNILDSVCNGDLSKSKAILVSPSIELTSEVTRALGIVYIFHLIHKDEEIRLVQMNPTSTVNSKQPRD